MELHVGIDKVDPKLRLHLCWHLTQPFQALPSAPAASPSIESRRAPKMQRGDLVRLRSGGPLMTVNKVEGDRVDCFWTDWNGQPSDAVFPYDVLQKF
jgi:uncharacterized protein YodC (DUF2158 family)